MSTQAQDRAAFHVEEYRALRAEIMLYLREIEQFSRLAIVAVAAIYVWLLSGFDAGPGLERVNVAAWWLPSIVIAVSWKKTEDMIRRIRTLADYLVLMQKIHADPALGGWETYARSDAGRTRRNRASDWTGRIVWSLSLAASLGLALSVTLN